MTETGLILSGGRVIDPSSGVDAVIDVRVRHDKIDAIGENLDGQDFAAIDCSGLVVAPGFVDLHTHLRVPGFEHKETLGTGTAAAAAGGYTTILCMPNTSPPLDNPDVLRDLWDRIASEALVRVLPIATISQGRKGLEPVDYAALAAAGAVAFSDDGDSTLDSQVMVEALVASRELNLPVMVHCEDRGLVGGSMHEGEVSRQLGIRGIPAEAEEVILARDLLLAEQTGGWLYALHVSTQKGADLIRQAKAKGVRVSAEVMPHHLLMTDRWVAGVRRFENVDERPGTNVPAPDPLAKVNPPLRTADDTRGLLHALLDGTFDVIATDHAPHAMSEKQEIPIEKAAFGMSGLEFALPLVLGLVRAGHLTLSRMIDLMSLRPAGLLGLNSGKLVPGAPADIVVFDPAEIWTVEADKLATKSPNTPLLGMQLQGKVRLTMFNGVVRYRK